MKRDIIIINNLEIINLMYNNFEIVKSLSTFFTSSFIMFIII